MDAAVEAARRHRDEHGPEILAGLGAVGAGAVGVMNLGDISSNLPSIQSEYLVARIGIGLWMVMIGHPPLRQGA
jgi:hypothetical protein